MATGWGACCVGISSIGNAGNGYNAGGWIPGHPAIMDRTCTLTFLQMPPSSLQPLSHWVHCRAWVGERLGRNCASHLNP